MDKVLFVNSIAICRQCQIACAFTLGQEAVQNMVVLWRFANYEDKTRNYRKLPPVFSRVQHGPRLNPNWLYPTTAPWQHLEITANDHCRLQYQWSIQLSLNTTNNNRKKWSYCTTTQTQTYICLRLSMNIYYVRKLKQHGIIAKLAACISLQKHRHDINQINYRRIVSRITSAVLLVFTPLLLQSPK